MNNPKKILLTAIFVLFSAGNAAALVDFSGTKAEREITAAGFADYPPYGYEIVKIDQDNNKQAGKRQYLFHMLPFLCSALPALFLYPLARRLE